MNKRDIKRLNIGDYVIMKHNLGRGHISRIAHEWTESCGLPKRGRYPMIQYIQDVTEHPTWCTYLIVEEVRPKLRSVT